MAISFSHPISAALAAIFIAEFDNDDMLEGWHVQGARYQDHREWVEARKRLDVFICGLHNQRLSFEADNEKHLVHAFTFVLSMSEISDTWNEIEHLADRYLNRHPELDSIKDALLLECGTLHQELLKLEHRFLARP